MSARPGILHVLSDPGQHISEDEFHDWYNNEHGPDRMRLPGVISGLRYKATDGLLPPWLATYELDDTALLQQPVYTRLRENRSPHEARVVLGLNVLERAVYRMVATRGEFHSEPGSIAVTVGLTASTALSSDLEDWYTKEHIDMLSRISGWLRSRLLVFDKASVSGFSQYLAIHEYTALNGLGGPEHKEAMSTPWRTRIMSGVKGGPHRRVFVLHHTFSKIPNDLDHLPSTSLRVIDSVFPRKDGVSLHYRLEGNPTGPTLVFSNSLLTDLHIWDEVIPHFAPTYKVLRYDTRGHGRSTGMSGKGNIVDLSSDLLSLLSALNITRVHCLIGVSLGGVTALHFALTNPNTLSRVVAADCNIASNPGNTAAWEMRIALARSPSSGFPELARQTLDRWFLPLSLTPQRIEGVQAVERMILSTSLLGFESGARALCDYDIHLPSLRVPALFVAGEHDGTLPEVLKSATSTVANSQFVMIREAGHLPMVENPTAFSNALTLFM